MQTTALTNATVFTGETVHENCSIVIERGIVRRLLLNGCYTEGTAAVTDVKGRVLAPGFIDMQVNGGGGVLFNNTPTVESLRIMGNAHSRFGTTAFLPTLISDHYEVMRAGLDAVRRANQEAVPGVLGIHLEGPFLSAERRGVHDATRFRTIDDEAMEIITSLRPDLVTLITLAPEMTTPDVIARLCSAGVIVFMGHSAANYEQCQAALNAGASGFTHLFNGMTSIAGQEPGLVGAALEPGESAFSIIADGHHVHPAAFRAALNAAGRGRAVLITDAMPTVGSREKAFELYGKPIELREGVLRDWRGSLAGSHLNMIDAVRNAMHFAKLDCWEALRMASCYSARVLGVESHRGFIRPGYAADFVELDEDMSLHRTWVAGKPIPAM